ncbi:MAG: AraC family transcriptional regulator [Erysipelotrichaceae bacterium]
MKQQDDWYTGIDHHQNLREQDIIITRMKIDQDTKQFIHERVILVYVFSGEATICINGVDFPIKKGSFLCLYMHHFYHFHDIKIPLDIVCIEFYIGLFMYMCWEKHPQHANASLMYDTKAMVQLEAKNLEKIEYMILDMIKEKNDQRFNGINIITYETLSLHSYYCRFAFEGIVKSEDSNTIWNIILKTVLATGEDFSLEDMATDFHLSSAYINQKIKEACGYTFFQLQQFGKAVNACALLHYSELTIPYICDLLNYSSMTNFYRVFKRLTNMTPREYQYEMIEKKELVINQSSLLLQILQFIHLHYNENLNSKIIADEFQLKEYALKTMVQQLFNKSINDIIDETRIAYAQSFLRASNESITSISTKCGFDSLVTFQRMMMQYTYQTASDYRNQFSRK